MDTAFLLDRITKTKEQIVAYEDAILAIAQGGVQSYTLDTGQTRQTVTKADLSQLQTALESLYNRLCTMQTRYSGGGTIQARPAT